MNLRAAVRRRKRRENELDAARDHPQSVRVNIDRRSEEWRAAL